MKFLAEIGAVAAWNFRTLTGRLGGATVAVVGFTGVVLVLVGMFSIQQGFQSTVNNTGADDIAKVNNSAGGNLSQDALRTIGGIAGVANGAHGPLVAGNYKGTARLAKRSDSTKVGVNVLGVPGNIRRVWTKAHIVNGRWLKLGLNEMIVGRMAARTFKGLALGKYLNWSGRRWQIVGIFASGGDSHESELWVDVHNMQSVYDAGSTFTSAYVRLISAGAFPAFKQALTHNPRLSVSVERESQYFQEAAGGMAGIIGEMGSVIALLMAVGAIFGAVMILDAHVADRVRDIATLRALGFTRTPIITAVLLEAASLALTGGILGTVLAYLAFNGIEASTANQGAVIAFHFTVTPVLFAAGILIALAMGLIGGMFPAIRAARLPISKALRET